MPLNNVFLRPQNWSRVKILLLKHYYRRQGKEVSSTNVIQPSSLEMLTRNLGRIDVSSETGRTRFRRARFQTPTSARFLALTEFWGESSVSSSQPIICVPKRTHRVFFSFSQSSPSLL